MKALLSTATGGPETLVMSDLPDPVAGAGELLVTVKACAINFPDVLMVAAHLGDLRAAKGVGLKTAFVARPREYGRDGTPDLKADASVDLSAKDFNDLAAQLGA